VEGLAAAGATQAGDPLNTGCTVATTAPTAATDGQAQKVICGTEGTLLTKPYTYKEAWLAGAANTTANTATTVIAAQGANIKIYVTSFQCSNSSATTTTFSLNDTVTSQFICPAGAGTNLVFPVPLVVTAANTALTATAAAGVTTIYFNAQGYKGP
jgi:hypothetical protein